MNGDRADFLPFASREDAARRLARALAHHRGGHPLVLAIPRGAVPMGRIVARELDGELDVVLVRKLAGDDNPEFALGAVDESGEVGWAPHARHLPHVARALEPVIARERAVIARRRRRYRALRPAADPRDRVTIVVDDGLATGATMIAALRAVRARAPRRLVCAVPVAAAASLDDVRGYCDELVCLATPEPFMGVGQFYRRFDPVEDAEAEQALADASGEHPERHPRAGCPSTGIDDNRPVRPHAQDTP
jgi:predicted phosphoribosyltransferase